MLNFSIIPSSAKDDNILIAYFDRTENSLEDTDATTSASKVSEASPAVMAQMIKNQTGGDVFSIVVSDKYPSDYDECLSRAQQENDANARPALNTTVQNMNSYDTIFLGFPDWCGTCPMAIFTFLESYDFAGKTIIPFCAHGTSGFGTSISDIKNVCPNSVFEQEFGVYRDSGASCEEELQAWLSELGYDKEPEMTLTNDMVTIHATEPIDSASLILAGYAAGTLMNVNIRKVSTDSTVLDGLTLPAADIVGKDLTSVNNRVKDWLTGLGIDVGGKEMDGTPIKITIGSRTLEGYLNNTPEAEQFKAMLPITVSMVGYGGREYYGGISGTINDSTEGKLNFENGDITYCPTNNTVAIFYAQTSRPNLTMRVISMGMVTSDLSVFDELGGNEDITFSLAE